ncbi:hypothetical protein AB4Y85_11815 [Microvirga sp. 2YAF29]|uniref:hypothetical protein n=1 Tax=Microvirga sp. 2YAF29 TaxID=3233031 RepID=UPI003F9C2D2A
MRILLALAFVITGLGVTETSAQTVEDALPQQRDVQKATCQKEARLIYRNGRNTSSQWLIQVQETRKAYVQDCMTKAGFAIEPLHAMDRSGIVGIPERR